MKKFSTLTKMTTVNFWQTVEVESWSRDFNYENYCLRHKEQGTTAAKLTEEGYKSFCQLMEAEMDRTYITGES